MDIHEMLKPHLLADFIEIETDPEMVGKIIFYIAGKDIQLSKEEEKWAKAIQKDAERMHGFVAEKKAHNAEKQRLYRERKRQETLENRKAVSECVTSVTNVTKCHQPYITEHTQHTEHTEHTEHTHRSVSVPETTLTRTREDAGKPANGNGNGTVDTEALLKKVREFQRALKDDNTQGAGAFFDPTFDAAVICTALTGDYKSHMRWRQLVNAIGQDEIRLELQQFYAEINAGEVPDNYGAALNARLGKIAKEKEG